MATDNRILISRVRTSFGITVLYNFLASVLSVSDMISTAGHDALLHDMIVIMIMILMIYDKIIRHSVQTASHAIKQIN